MDLIPPSKEFFIKYPKIKEACKKIPNPNKKCWYDIEYLDDCVMLFEKMRHDFLGCIVSTDRIIMIDNEGKISDTREVIK